mmetsp:Transcript_9791/g.22299  ORF Transcript_9791/g.22299 Transcript_9791/m.22299 type:complete len:148 (+) Transcript_9791:68-511(+)
MGCAQSRAATGYGYERVAATMCWFLSGAALLAIAMLTSSTETFTGEIASGRTEGHRRWLTEQKTADYVQLRQDFDRLNERGYDLYKVQGAALVLIMQIGFGCLEAGKVPGQHVALMLVKNLVDMCIAGIMWPVGIHVTGYEGLSEAE